MTTPSPADRLAALLEPFRDVADSTAIEEAKRDEDAVRLAKAWTSTRPVIREPMFLGAPPLHKHNRWKYLWKFPALDVDALAARAGVDPAIAREKFDWLIARYLVLPDGTLSPRLAGALPAAPPP